MSEEQDRRFAAAALVSAWILALHPWVPALLVGGCVFWVIAHNRLEGELGASLARLWRRAWPPAMLALTPLLLASAILFWMWDAPTMAKVLPVALSLLGLSTVLRGILRRAFVRPERSSPSASPRHALD